MAWNTSVLSWCGNRTHTLTVTVAACTHLHNTRPTKSLAQLGRCFPGPTSEEILAVDDCWRQEKYSSFEMGSYWLIFVSWSTNWPHTLIHVRTSWIWGIIIIINNNKWTTEDMKLGGAVWGTLRDLETEMWVNMIKFHYKLAWNSQE